MKVKVLEEGKKKIVFEIEGEDHTFCNPLKKALHDVPGVHIATYAVTHPLVGVPRFVVETTNISPREALQKAVASLRKEYESLKKSVAALK